MRREKDEFTKSIASERIAILFSLARAALKENRAERAKRYVRLARGLGTRYLVRFPKATKRSYCKKCGMPWIAGRNLRVRIKPKEFVEYACLSCNARSIFPHKSRLKKR